LNFKRSAREEPEINLIPFIDVLLVVLIFLMLSTTYGQFTRLQVKLPTVGTATVREQPKEIRVTVTADGRYAVNQVALETGRLEELVAAIGAAADKSSPVRIDADASASHRAVVMVMEAARRAGLTQVSFGAQTTAVAR